MKEEIEKAIENLAKEINNWPSKCDVMHYSQSILNLANAIVKLEYLGRPDKKGGIEYT